MTFARLEMLHAREANETVIFRRGPSKWVQILKWNTVTDEIIQGHWFNGRIYTEKADLSPCGNYMIYFAAKFKKEIDKYSWTAISKPPYLTAIALWKKSDTFNGGGLFESKKSIYLSHTKNESQLEGGFNIHELQVRIKDVRFPFDHIELDRMKRDGWMWSDQNDLNLYNADIQYGKVLNEHLKIIHIGKKKIDPKYTENQYDWKTFAKRKRDMIEVKDYENIDANQNGRILMSKNGCIYSCENFEHPETIQLVANLNENKPYELETPIEMTRW